MKRSSIKQIAYHEAGHAFMCFYLHKRLGSVTIISTQEYEGRCELGKTPDLLSERYQSNALEKNRLYRIEREKLAMISLAGSLAVSMLMSRKHTIGADTDVLQVTSHLASLTRSMEEEEAYAKWLWHRTKGILQIEPHWSAVKVLANELLREKRIGAKRVCEIIKNSLEKFKHAQRLKDAQATHDRLFGKA